MMTLSFHERIPLPPGVVYGYFRSPADWVRLYGAFGRVEQLEDGWQAVRLRAFPFPLVAKIVEDEPNRRVRWRFRGFWQGEGAVDFDAVDDGVIVSGYERISPRGLFFAAPLVERLYLEKRFRAIWRSGFRRLRRQAQRERGEPSGR